MICPQCGADNAAGRVICHKCGAPLASEEKPLGIVEKRRGVGSIVGKIIGILIVLCLAGGGGLAFLSFKRPAVGITGSGAQLASAKKKIEELKKEHQNGWDSIISLSEPELNAWLKDKISQVASKYLGAPTGQSVRLEEVTLEIAPEVSKAVIGVFWKWKTSYIYLEGKPTLERGFILCHIDKAKIGPINLPEWTKGLLLGKILGKLEDDTLRIALPFYVENLICNKGELVLYTAPEKPGTEGAAPRLFARAEELIRRENYSDAIKVFNRIIDFYKGSSELFRCDKGV